MADIAHTYRPPGEEGIRMTSLLDKVCLYHVFRALVRGVAIVINDLVCIKSGCCHDNFVAASKVIYHPITLLSKA